MKWVFRAGLIVILALVLSACGSKKSPTGGPVDNVKPEVLSIIPQEYDQLSELIEITFSKPMDKNCFLEGLYFYPPLINKKISYSGRTLSIRINEKLQENTNYHLTLSTRIKDIRGNSLSQSRSYTFASGKLQDLSLGGNIEYEIVADGAKPVILDIFSADSLWVRSDILNGSSYRIEALNPAGYHLRAYQDKDSNGRYDFGREPIYEGSVDLKRSANLNLLMAYQDSIMVEIKSVRAGSSQELEINFNKEPASMGSIAIQSTSGKNLPVLYKELEGTKLTLVTAKQDSTEYRIIIHDLKDHKQNHNKLSGARFKGNLKEDESTLRLLGSTPRNGTSVADLQPQLHLRFNNIIPTQGLKIKLIATDSNSEIPIRIHKADSKTCIIQPVNALINYRSYKLILLSDTTDALGNKLGKEESISFLPLMK